jgi:integrase
MTKTKTDHRRSRAERVTKRNVDRLAEAPGRYPVADAKGLFLKVKATGKALWTYRYRLDGKETETSLGAYPETTIDAAIVAHAERRAQVVKKIDPLAAKRTLTPEPASPSAFSAFAHAYVAAKRADWTSKRHIAQWGETIDMHCKPIATTPVDEIDRAAVLSVIEPLWTRKPETARRVLKRIEIVLDYAYVRLGIEDKIVNQARFKGKLDKVLLAKRPAVHHFAAMPYADMPAFMTRLRSEPGNGARCLEFLILTAARTSEAIGAKWGEIDLKARLWTVPASRMKGKKQNRREHRVPLSDAAAGVLETQIAANPDPDPDSHVFPGRGRGRGQPWEQERPLSPAAMLRVLKAMGTPVTGHGFRSSFRDFVGDETDFPREVAEQAIAHVVKGVEGDYRRGDALMKRRELMQAWSDFLNGKQDANVVSLAQRRA